MARLLRFITIYNCSKMKYLFTFSVIISLFISSLAQNTAITAFYEGPFADVQNAAKRDKKYIFIDFTSNSCAHCIKMQKETFANKEIAEQLNHDFIAYKVDINEQDGKDLAKKYDIKEYPSFVILDQNTKALATIKGYYKAPQFLKEIHKIAGQNKPKAIETKKKRRFFGLFG